MITRRTDDINATVVRSKFEILGLNLCNLSHFPYFLKYQDRLRYLDLGGNNIHGLIPKGFGIQALKQWLIWLLTIIS